MEAQIIILLALSNHEHGQPNERDTSTNVELHDHRVSNRSFQRYKSETRDTLHVRSQGSARCSTKRSGI
ncbi:hypothetical protein PsYK624_076030 [Phanerochaete sordida]|uniref:Uncharacterized protein n=1 Tax=Phanerochaete sordida TaxID=48140 RepID=A0A9P3LEF3_9APHY|nr:hypothetical protein PsYK624_076030 [Phanerochaete sordida]